MMDDDRALVPSRGVTDAATVAIALQDHLPQPSEVFLLLSLERVAGRTQTLREDFLPAHIGSASLAEFPFSLELVS